MYFINYISGATNRRIENSGSPVSSGGDRRGGSAGGVHRRTGSAGGDRRGGSAGSASDRRASPECATAGPITMPDQSGGFISIFDIFSAFNFEKKLSMNANIL